MRIIKSRLAREDIVETAKYIAEDNIDAAIKFLDAVEDTCDLLKTQPKIGSTRRFNDTNLPELRIWSVHKFSNFLIVYSLEPDRIIIQRVIDGRRDFTLLFDL